MPISTISQIISTIPEAGRRGVDVQTQFVIKQEDFQDHLQGTTVNELNNLKSQINTTVIGMNEAVTTVNTKASEASTSASSASISANTATTKASEASASASSASTSATKAGKWADNAYNVEVEVGKYSAKHWSNVAQNTVNNKVDKVTSTDNAIPRFNGTTGDIQNSGVIIDDNNNIIMPNGSKFIGDFSNATLSNRPMFQTNTTNGNTAVSVIPNGTATSAYISAHNSSDMTNYSICSISCTPTSARVSSSSAGTTPNIPLNFFVAGIDRATLDTNGNFLLLVGGGSLGYGAGAGGTVTQLTNKTTGVTLNKPSGQITTSNSSLASGVTTSFYLINSLLSNGDNLIINCNSHANYSVRARVGGGAAEIIIIQNSGSTLSEAIVINYSVIKGANS